MKGDMLPVSRFFSYLTGAVPPGATSEKQGITLIMPEWIPENCIQCNRCSSICPSMAICSVILKENEEQEVCAYYPTIKMIGMEGYQFAISVSSLSCTGCGQCVRACPGKKEKKALQLEKFSLR